MQPPRRNRAISLAEMLVVVAVVGILGAIAIPIITDLGSPAREEVGRSAVERLNRAVQLHGQLVGPIAVEAAGGADDELAVVGMLQTAYPSTPGTPILNTSLLYEASSDPAKLRAFWDGAFFQLLPEGQTGDGLDLQAQANPDLEGEGTPEPQEP